MQVHQQFYRLLFLCAESAAKENEGKSCDGFYRASCGHCLPTCSYLFSRRLLENKDLYRSGKRTHQSDVEVRRKVDTTST